MKKIEFKMKFEKEEYEEQCKLKCADAKKVPL